MELLKKCQDLYEELRTVNDALKFISEKLKRLDLDIDEYEALYKEEFRLSVELVGTFEDLQAALTALEKTSGMEFLANRMRKNAEQIVSVEVIDVSRNI